ncbi:MAG: hypothetical protein AAGC74_04950 [Verrucomicrobiota bacterium]
MKIITPQLLKTPAVALALCVWGICLPLSIHAEESTPQIAQRKNLGFLVTVQAQAGKEAEVAQFLAELVELAEKESKTLTWYAFQIDETSFGIFDTFHDEEGRQEHLHGEIAKRLKANAKRLLSEAPSIQNTKILSSKS